MLRLSDFDYDLPEELIAQYPTDRRGQSRLMIIHRATGELDIGEFGDITAKFDKGDTLVLNNTKVFPCRLRARKPATGANMELLLLREVEQGLWEALVRPGKRASVGTQLSIPGDPGSGTVEVVADHGMVKKLKFETDDVSGLCWRCGEMPLPPYIKRAAGSEDLKRYQTVFARHEGAAAAPTAGLHFSEDMLRKLRDGGIMQEFVTLHTGLGTFQPLEHEEIEKNELHPERYNVESETARRLNEARRSASRVVAVGTTTLRVLETVFTEQGEYSAGEGISDIFIYPGYNIRSADALLTNFHLPRSSLLLLVCAFAGQDIIMKAYETALRERFRFYSYGDAMLIL